LDYFNAVSPSPNINFSIPLFFKSLGKRENHHFLLKGLAAKNVGSGRKIMISTP
jgi:hypothetical protein